jgi:luciferase family oxidoreductase group 1
MVSRIPVSILDFCPVLEGETPRESFEQVTHLATRAENLGYKRFWVAEHHGAQTVASAATSVVISHIASRTKAIRVGAGGIMLPNHAPLVVAEQFGTLASLYPDRIDLGLGRSVGASPGREELMARALRLEPDARERYVSDISELQSYFQKPDPEQPFVAVPGSGIDVPLWLLGSSTFSAAEAGALGLPFVFATQIAPNVAGAALEKYRSSFSPSEALDRPHVMVCVFVIAADTDEAGQHLLTSLQLSMLGRLRGHMGPLQRPVRSLEAVSTEEERTALARIVPLAVVGSRRKVFNELDRLITHTAADELMVLTLVYDQAARNRSFEILTEYDGFALGMH